MIVQRNRHIHRPILQFIDWDGNVHGSCVITDGEVNELPQRGRRRRRTYVVIEVGISRSLLGTRLAINGCQKKGKQKSVHTIPKLVLKKNKSFISGSK
jgi:hypothetical protein